MFQPVAWYLVELCWQFCMQHSLPFNTHHCKWDVSCVMIHMPFVAADGKDVLIYQVDGCEHKVMAGTFDRLVKQLAGEEKPGEGRAGVGSCTHACWVVLVCCFFITLLSPSSLLPPSLPFPPSSPSLLHTTRFTLCHHISVWDATLC